MWLISLLQFMVLLIDLLMGWLICWLIDGSINWSLDLQWLFEWLTGWFIDWLWLLDFDWWINRWIGYQICIDCWRDWQGDWSVTDPGGHPGRGPLPIGLENFFFQVKEIISFGCASSARLLICIYLFWGLGTMANGQWPFILLCLCSWKSKFYYKLY